MTVYLSIIMIISTTTRRRTTTTTIMSFASKMKTLQQALDEVINTATPSEEMQIRTFLSSNMDHIIEKSTARDATLVASEAISESAAAMISGARERLMKEAKSHEKIVCAAGVIEDVGASAIKAGRVAGEAWMASKEKTAAEKKVVLKVAAAATAASTVVDAAVAKMKEIENSWTRTIASMDDDEEEEAEVLASIIQMDSYARSEVKSMGYGVAEEAIAMIMDTKGHPTNQTVAEVAEEVVAKVSNAMVSVLNDWEAGCKKDAADERARDPNMDEDEEELEKRAHVLDRKADEISFIRKDVIEAVKKAMEGWRNEIAS